MRFVGVDLAWSSRNPSGVAVMEGDELGARVMDVRTVSTDEEILDVVRRAAKPDQPVFVAIDAPLVVPNKTGRRKAEEFVGMVFGQYEAGAHPANRRLLAKNGKVRGEELVKALVESGVKHDPRWKPLERSRKCFEVYPHPAMVALFRLGRTLKYKPRKGRSYEDRWAAFRKYQRLLGKLPDVRLPKDLLERDVEGLKASKLKGFEDRLDATFCAYIAYYAWKEPGKCAVLGNMEEGYILTPTLPEQRESL